jgi:3-hydroxyisobutyrate dehydrogenase
MPQHAEVATNVGFVGMGSMGTPMVEQMVAAGYTVRVLCRRQETASAADALGAVPVTTVAEVAQDAEVVTVCVYTTEQVRELCLGTEGLIAAMKPGSVLLVHTTCPPETMADLVTSAGDRGVSVVDAPLDGRPRDVAGGTVRVLMGAGPEARSRIAPIVATYTAQILHVGDVGAGQRTKILHVLLTAAQTGMIAAAARLAEDLGLDPAASMQALGQTNARSYHLESAVAFSSDPTQHAELVKPFVTKDIQNYGDIFDDLDLGLLGVVVNAYLADARDT